MSLTLFKFMPAEHARTSIVKKRVKVSLLSDLNDPYEWVPAIVSGAGAPVYDTEEVRQIFHKRVDDRLGMICMSKVPHEPLLWSHYADSHRGIALAFTFPENSGAEEVNYVRDRIAINLDAANDGCSLKAVFERLLLQKHEGWSYEQEYRFIVPVNQLSKDDGLYWKMLSDVYFSGVILGCRCEFTEKDVLQWLVESDFDGIAVAKAQMNPRHFAIDLQQFSAPYFSNRAAV